MKINEWLDHQDLQKNSFAQKLGVTAAAVSQYGSGARIPSRAIMSKIVELTDGQVTPNDFYVNEVFNDSTTRPHESIATADKGGIE